MKILRYLDLLWFIGESFHRKEKAPGDGNSLILWCWYLDVLLPMLTLMHCWLPEGIFFVIAVPVLLLAPWICCRFRYTERRRKEIFAVFHERQTGRLLLYAWGSMIGICCLEAFLLLHFGFWE